MNKFDEAVQSRIATMELNQEVMIKLFGWQPFYSEEVKQICFCLPDGSVRNPFHVPDVSTEVSAFFEVVVPAMQARGFHLEIDDDNGAPWWVCWRSAYNIYGGSATGATLPLAGCHATLEALADKAQFVKPVPADQEATP